MALSGKFQSSQVTDVGNYPSYVYVEWKATQSIADNTSTISWKCYGGSTYNNAVRYTTTGPVVVKINGTTVLNKTGRFNMTQGMLLGSGSLKVPHNVDGTKSVSVSISAAIYYSYANSAYSGTITLNTIPRASEITIANPITLGNYCSVKWTPASNNFRYQLEFELGSWKKRTSYITPNTTSAYTYTSYKIEASDALYQQIPKEKGTMTVRLYTYNSLGTYLGTSEPKTFEVTMPNKIGPSVGTITLAATPVTINGTSYNYLIRNVNKLTISTSGATAGSGSSIKSYTFSGPSVSTTTKSNSISVNSVNDVGTLEYTVTVTDSRERSTSANQTIVCYDYSRPSVTLKVSRNAQQLTCTYKPSFASINGRNCATVKIYVDGSLQQTETVTTETSGKVQLTLANATKTYEVYATITDGLGSSEKSNVCSVYGAPKVINITPDGTGVAFGKVAEEKGCVDVPKLSSRSNLVIKSSGKGLYINNKDGTVEPAIYRNTGGNLWIGAMGTNSNNITGGGTYISTGANNDLYVGKYVNNLSTRVTYRILDTENYKTYLPMRPTMLYSSTSGSAGTITLENSVQNYTYIEIFYRDTGTTPTEHSLRYWRNAGGRIDISSIECSPVSEKVYLRTSRYTVADTLITFARSQRVAILDSGTSVDETTTSSSNYFKITKVIGYSAE